MHTVVFLKQFMRSHLDVFLEVPPNVQTFYFSFMQPCDVLI